MASIKTKFSVGMFVILGSALATVAIIWLGMSNYFEKGRYHVAYFDESVQGLEKDSPVKYRGVSIGRVDEIGVAPDATLIQVVLKIETETKLGKDIVAQLKSIGITGIMFIELDRKKSGKSDLSPIITFTPEYPVIATKPSEVGMFIGSINDVLNQLKKLDLEGISDKSKLTLDNINKAIEDTRLKEISSDISASLEKTVSSFNKLTANIDKTFANINNTVTRIDKIVADNEKGLREAISDFKLSVENAGVFLGQGAELIKKTDVDLYNLQRQLSISLQNIENASRKLNRFLELIADQPSQLIFGEPPPARKTK